MALRWGIASVGKISFDFVNALGILPKENHQAVAVAARDLVRAEQFAQKFDIPTAYEGYVKLAEDPNVEVVSVATVNPQHFPVAKLMLEHGKHVLIEKPLCINAKQSEQLIALARENKLFLMEAIWSRCFPSYQHIRQQIQDDKLGDIKSVTVDFGFPMGEIERLTYVSICMNWIWMISIHSTHTEIWLLVAAVCSLWVFTMFSCANGYSGVGPALSKRLALSRQTRVMQRCKSNSVMATMPSHTFRSVCWKCCPIRRLFVEPKDKLRWYIDTIV